MWLNGMIYTKHLAQGWAHCEPSCWSPHSVVDQRQKVHAAASFHGDISVTVCTLCFKFRCCDFLIFLPLLWGNHYQVIRIGTLLIHSTTVPGTALGRGAGWWWKVVNWKLSVSHGVYILMAVLVSYCCCNELPFSGLKTTQINFLTVLEVGSLKSVSQGVSTAGSCWGSEERNLFCLFGGHLCSLIHYSSIFKAARAASLSSHWLL